MDTVTKVMSAITSRPPRVVFAKLVELKAFELLKELLDNAAFYGDLKIFYEWSHDIFRGIIEVENPDEETLGFLSWLLNKEGYSEELLNNERLFSYCVKHGAHPSIIRYMLESGCSPYYLDRDGQSLFHVLALSSSLSREHAIAYIHLFARSRLDIDQKNMAGYTPLILAIISGNVDLVFAFLSYGANIYARDHAGRDAFYYAVVHQRNLEMYTYLSSFVEPPFDAYDSHGYSILDYFVWGIVDISDFPLLKQMIKDGADIWRNSVSNQHCIPPIDTLLVKDCKLIASLLKFVKVNTRDFHGDTMLHKLCRSIHPLSDDSIGELLEKIKLLVRKGADTSIENNLNMTPMQVALEDPRKALIVEFLKKNSISLGTRFFLRDWWRN